MIFVIVEYYFSVILNYFIFFFSSRRRHTRYWRDWSSDVCSSDLSIGKNIFDISKMFLPILITLVSLLVFTLVISALSMCVCSFAKNYKQAQGYLTPLMLVTMIPAYASMIPMLELNTKTAMIPVVNVVMLIKAVFFMDVNMKLAGLVLLSNLAFIVIALVLLAKIFKSEEDRKSVV